MSHESIPRVQQIAHDVRHCLFTIRTGILLIRENYKLEDDQHELFAAMEKDQKQLAGLVEELVSLAAADRATPEVRQAH